MFLFYSRLNLKIKRPSLLWIGQQVVFSREENSGLTNSSTKKPVLINYTYPRPRLSFMTWIFKELTLLQIFLNLWHPLKIEWWRHLAQGCKIVVPSPAGAAVCKRKKDFEQLQLNATANYRLENQSTKAPKSCQKPPQKCKIVLSHFARGENT